MKEEPFLGKSVIVTGASLGIGRALALQLADKGARLVLGARSTDELQRVASLCRDRGGEAIAVTTDISDPSQCKRLIERTVEELGRIDTLINNAGMGMAARFDELRSMDLMETIMRVDFWGAVYCTHSALQYLFETKGRIVMIISGGGLFVTPNACGYGASKHALAGFSKTLRVELAGTGVSVTSFYPDWVATGISARAPGPDGRPLGRTISHERGAMSPEACARLILKATAKRSREAMSARHRVGLIFAPFFPGLVDRISSRAFAEVDTPR